MKRWTVFLFVLTILGFSAPFSIARQIDQKALPVQADHQTSFETPGAGVFKTLESKLGIWTTHSGRAVIDDQHAKTGTQCLHLTGGEKTVVTLEFAPEFQTDRELTFAAERWTIRTPFSFRIEKKVDDQWTEIYNGDDRVKVGRAFLSRVIVPLGDQPVKQIRFTVTSPANTGILIDDLEISQSQPQQVVDVQEIPVILPALVGVKAVPLKKIRIDTVGRADPISLDALVAHIDTTHLKTVQMYYTGDDGNFGSKKLFGAIQTESNKKTLEASNQRIDELFAERGQQILREKKIAKFERGTNHFVFEGNQHLSEGANYFWIAGTLKDNASPDARLVADFDDEIFSRQHLSVKRLRHLPNGLRIGVSVRNGGDDGVHTYRIPGMATTNKGTLIGVYDVRRDKGGDLPGNIDVGMSRSIDGGRTWEPMRIIMDMGQNPKWNFDGIGDPSVLVDRKTGTIWVSATWSHGNRSWNGSGPGLNPEETGQWMLVKSDDDGLTWSKPINITEQIKKPEWCFLLQGPGKGITMSDGTLVFPAQYQDPPNPNDKAANRRPHSTIVYSRDHGKTWQVGTGAHDDTTESQVVELENGTLMLNCRFNRESRRVVMTTKDLGQTWEEHPTNRKSLIEPRACMASLINVGRELKLLKGIDKHKDLLLFSNPNSLNGRNHITIKASLDGGLTWPKKNQLLLDEQNGRGYSCMSMIDENTVGILYEGSQAHMTFQRIKIDDLLHPERTRKPSNPDVSSLLFDESDLNPNRQGHLSVARVFGSNMVLQANRPIRIWGTAKKNSAVKIEFANRQTTTVADVSGHWNTELPAQAHNATPQNLQIHSDNRSVSIDNVLIGDVWLCAGQSNMEWPLSQSTNGPLAIQNSADPQLRLMNFVGSARGGNGLYTRQHFNRLTPELFGDGHWQVASRSSTAEFSAVGYYFASKLRSNLDCPIGVINLSIGGTPIESWIGTKWLAAEPELASMVDGNWLENPALDDWCKQRGKSNLKHGIEGRMEMPGDEFGPNHSFKPGFMFKSAIEKFAPMSIRGVLWYQGESNADHRKRITQYESAFPVLVESFRTVFENADLPIVFVQLPALGRPNWPIFREQQRRSLSQLKNVGMAITMDVGHPTNVHPKFKQPVGDRLAAWALNKVYQKPVVPMGPLVFQKSKPNQQSLNLTFKHVGDGLKTIDGRKPLHFEVAGADGKFHPATATISGRVRINLTSTKIEQPIHARYAWTPYPKPTVNLINSAGLPASPFTTEEEY